LYKYRSPFAMIKSSAYVHSVINHLNAVSQNIVSGNAYIGDHVINLTTILI